MFSARRNPSFFALLSGIFFCGITFSVNSFSQVTFQRTFGNSAANNNDGTSQGTHGVAFPTSDGGYALIGSFGYTSTDANVLLVKMNSSASSYWAKTYYNGIGSSENGYSGIQTNDGGYIISGGHLSGVENLFFVKTTSDGTVSWTKRYSGVSASAAVGYSVVQTSDGGYLVGGSAKTGASGTFMDMYMVRMASDGSNIWAKGYSGTNTANDYGFQAITTIDGGYSIVGNMFNGSNNDVFFVKTNSDGTPSWTDQINVGGNDIGYSVAQTSDGGYIITGIGHGNGDLLLVKLDNSGAHLWTKTFALSDDSEGRSIKETPDGGFIIAGNVQDGTYNNMILMKTTNLGVFSWCKVFAGTAGVGGSSDEFGSSVVICPDGGFLVSGYIDNPGTSNQIFYLVKTNSDGMTTSSSCPVTTSVTATATSRTPTIVSTPTATSTFNSITTVGSSSTQTITAKNPCNNSTNLPVEMLSIKAFCEYGKAVLRWVTASETNNDYFSIERSADGKDFQTVGKVYGFGTSSVTRSYEFADNEIRSEGMLFYRIKQMDYNGQYEYFGPVSVKCNSKEIEINPTVSEGIYFITGDLNNAEIIVYSVVGEKINPVNRMLASVIDISNQPTGIYFVKVITPDGCKIQKIIKK